MLPPALVPGCGNLLPATRPWMLAPSPARRHSELLSLSAGHQSPPAMAARSSAGALALAFWGWAWLRRGRGRHGPSRGVRLAQLITPEECGHFQSLLKAPEPGRRAELARLDRWLQPEPCPSAMPGQRQRRREAAGRLGLRPRLPTCPTAAAGRAGGLAGCRGPVLVDGTTWPRPAARQRPEQRPGAGQNLHQQATLQLRSSGSATAATAGTPAVPARPCVPACSSVPEPDWDKLELIVERLPRRPYQRARGLGRAAGSRPSRLQQGAGRLGRCSSTHSVDHRYRRRWRLGALGSPGRPPRPASVSQGSLAVGKRSHS